MRKYYYSSVASLVWYVVAFGLGQFSPIVGRPVFIAITILVSIALVRPLYLRFTYVHLASWEKQGGHFGAYLGAL